MQSGKWNGSLGFRVKNAAGVARVIVNGWHDVQVRNTSYAFSVNYYPGGNYLRIITIKIRPPIISLLTCSLLYVRLVVEYSTR